MPTKKELLAHVQGAIATAIGAEESELTPEKMIFAELGVDSVDFLDISYEVERRTGCELAMIFESEEPDGRLTVQGLTDILAANLG